MRFLIIILFPTFLFASKLEVTTSSYAAWTSVPFQSYDTISLANGNYESWGLLDLDSGDSGTANQKRVIIRKDATDLTTYGNPIRFPSESYQVVLTIGTLQTVNHVTFRGLKIYGSAQIRTSDYISFYDNIIERKYNGSQSIRLRFGSDYAKFKRNYFLSSFAPRFDTNLAIYVEGSRGTVIDENEIVNYNDGIQLNESSNDSTIIINNDIYIADSLTQGDSISCAENAIDIKFGASTTWRNGRFDYDNGIIIRNNNFWGYRYADASLPCGNPSGSDGVLITCNISNARHILIKDNWFFDAPGGVRRVIVDTSVSNIRIIDNYFIKIKQTHSQVEGSPFWLRTVNGLKYIGEPVVGNIIINADAYATAHSSMLNINTSGNKYYDVFDGLHNQISANDTSIYKSFIAKTKTQNVVEKMIPTEILNITRTIRRISNPTTITVSDIINNTY